MPEPTKINHDLIDIRLIDEGDRQREGYGDTEGLAFSIDQKGLLSPIIVESLPSGRYKLIAGCCRLKACVSLGWLKIPAILKINLDEIGRKELELEENVRRSDLTWYEIAKANAALHKLKMERYKNGLPSKFGRSWGQKDTASELKISEAKLSQDIALAEASEKDPSILKAQTRRDALRQLNRISLGAPQEESIILKKLKESYINETYIGGMKTVAHGSVNLIITDITELQPSIMPDVLNKLLPTGHAFIFFDLVQYSDLIKLLSEAKVPHTTAPYIWHIVGEDNYRMFMWCSKYIVEPPNTLKSHHSHRQDPDSLHKLHKPYRLLLTLIECATARGQFVYDPCTYGSSLIKACIDSNRNCRAVCINATLYEQSIINYNKITKEI